MAILAKTDKKLKTTWLLKSNILTPNSLNENIWAPWRVNLIPVWSKDMKLLRLFCGSIFCMSIFFSSRLLQVARDFIAKRLGPFFVSAHIRAEKMLTSGITFNKSAAVKKCISNLTTLVQRYKKTSTVPVPLFLATDFADYGSSSYRAKVARKNAKSLMKI